MTRRAPLPSHEEVQLAIKQLTETTGKPPAVLAVARRLGLANTTFRRNFPDIAARLTQQRSPGAADPDPATGACRFEWLQRENAALRRANHELSEHVELAMANIQRLTLENHHLRRQLHAATNVTPIDPSQRPRGNRPH